MTFADQEVPENWGRSVASIMHDSRYERLSDFLADNEQCLTTNNNNNNNNQVKNDEEIIKTEDPYARVTTPYQPQGPTSMLASPSMNMPVLCDNYYNPTTPQQHNVRNMSASPAQMSASPSPNPYVNVNSPADSSSYSVSPIESPVHPLPPEDFAHYMARQRHQYSVPPPPPGAQEYGYYGYGGGEGAAGKLNRKMKDCELTQDEFEKRRLRRERNKQAALRCRNRRRERIDALEQEVNEIEGQNEQVEDDIRKLKNQIKELKGMLQTHECKSGGLGSSVGTSLASSSTTTSSSSSSSAGSVKVKPEPE